MSTDEYPVNAYSAPCPTALQKLDDSDGSDISSFSDSCSNALKKTTDSNGSDVSTECVNSMTGNCAPIFHFENEIYCVIYGGRNSFGSAAVQHFCCKCVIFSIFCDHLSPQ